MAELSLKPVKSVWFEIGVGAAAVAALLLITIFIGSDLGKRAQSILDKKQELASKTSALQASANLRSDFDKAKPYFSVFENILPTKDRLIRFPRDFEELSKKKNIEFGFSFGSEEESSEEVPGSLAYSMNVAGSYDKLLEFLKAADTGQYIVGWETLDFTRKDGDYRGILSGKVFSQ